MKADPRYNTQRWKNLRARVVAMYGRQCAVSGCSSDMTKPRMTHVDHIVEIQDGGAFWDINNLRVVCYPHHSSKSLDVAARRREPRSPNA